MLHRGVTWLLPLAAIVGYVVFILPRYPETSGLAVHVGCLLAVLALVYWAIRRPPVRTIPGLLLVVTVVCLISVGHFTAVHRVRIEVERQRAAFLKAIQIREEIDRSPLWGDAIEGVAMDEYRPVIDLLEPDGPTNFDEGSEVGRRNVDLILNALDQGMRCRKIGTLPVTEDPRSDYPGRHTFIQYLAHELKRIITNLTDMGRRRRAAEVTFLVLNMALDLSEATPLSTDEEAMEVWTDLQPALLRVIREGGLTTTELDWMAGCLVRLEARLSPPERVFSRKGLQVRWELFEFSQFTTTYTLRGLKDLDRLLGLVLPLASADYGGMRDGLESIRGSIEEGVGPGQVHPLSAQIVYELQVWLQNRTVCLADIRLARIAVAVRRLGRIPGRLEELTSGSLPAIPMDPFSGGSFLHRPGFNGVEIWSVGPDGNDNSGRNDDPGWHLPFDG